MWKGSSVCLFFFFSEPLGEAAQALSDSDQTPDKNKKKNRCFSCRKKVGLTGKSHENSARTVAGELLTVSQVGRVMSNEPPLLGLDTCQSEFPLWSERYFVIGLQASFMVQMGGGVIFHCVQHKFFRSLE